MGISQIADIANLLTVLVVLISLLFVLLELRHANRESRLANRFSATDRLYDFKGIARQDNMAGLIRRSRQSLDDPTDDEKLIFTEYLLRSLLAAHSFIRVAGQALEQKAVSQDPAVDIVRREFDHPGARAWWTSVLHDPPTIPSAAGFLDHALGLEETP
jgi:hypothetical protein